METFIVSGSASHISTESLSIWPRPSNSSITETIYIRSRNLIPPDIEIQKFDIRDYDDATATAEISADPSKYCAESFPDYEITDAAEYFQSDFLRGFYIRIEMRKKPG